MDQFRSRFDNDLMNVHRSPNLLLFRRSLKRAQDQCHRSSKNYLHRLLAVTHKELALTNVFLVNCFHQCGPVSGSYPWLGQLWLQLNKASLSGIFIRAENNLVLSARELGLERSTATEAVDCASLVGTELRSAYPQGPSRLKRPPRDDSLTFKNRSESGCIGLGLDFYLILSKPRIAVVLYS